MEKFGDTRLSLFFDNESLGPTKLNIFITQLSWFYLKRLGFLKKFLFSKWKQLCPPVGDMIFFSYLADSHITNALQSEICLSALQQMNFWSLSNGLIPFRFFLGIWSFRSQKMTLFEESRILRQVMFFVEIKTGHKIM